MLLVDLLLHFQNNNVEHYQRERGWNHDVYVNKGNKNKFTIPIDNDEIPIEFCQLGCLLLGIEGINGESSEELIKSLASLQLRRGQ